MQYYINLNRTREIKDIPFGFKTKHFTINPEGELSSSLTFLTTTEWIPVYSVLRTSTNKIIVSEIDSLLEQPVLLKIEDNKVLDASDSFFGEANNGRDCIRQMDNYSEAIIECNFQNNEVSYNPFDYIRGDIRSTGIARYNHKFNFTIVKAGDQYTVTLKPKASASFDFYVEFGGNICPKIVSKDVTLSGCKFVLFYSGTSNILFGTSTVTFANYTSNVTVPYGSYQIKSDGKGCLAVSCDRKTEVTSIVLETPDFQVVSPSVLDLAGKVQIATNFNNTMNSLDAVKANIQDAIDKLGQYADLIAQINFTKVVTDNPFKNFSQLRKDVDDLLEKLNSTTHQVPVVPKCSGVFGSVGCFFENALSTLIIVAVAIGAGIIIYFIAVKTKCHKKISKKFKKKKKDNKVELMN